MVIGIATASDSRWCLKIVVPGSWYWHPLRKNSVTDVLCPVRICVTTAFRYRWDQIAKERFLCSVRFFKIEDVFGSPLLRQPSRCRIWLLLCWEIEQGCRERRQRGRLATQPCVWTRLPSSRFCPLQNELAWHFINVLESGVKRCGTHQSGEAKHVWKRAECFILSSTRALPLSEPVEVDQTPAQFPFILLPLCHTDASVSESEE